MDRIRTLIWKEILERFPRGPRDLIRVGVFLGMFALPAVLISTTAALKFGPFLFTALFFASVIGAALVALDSFVGERERGTMETLLTEPLSEPAILAGKGLTAMVAWAAVATVVLAALLTGTLLRGGPGALLSFPWVATLAAILACAAAASLASALFAVASVFSTSVLTVQTGILLGFVTLQAAGLWTVWRLKLSMTALLVKLDAASRPESWVLAALTLGFLSGLLWLLAARLYSRDRLISS